MTRRAARGRPALAAGLAALTLAVAGCSDDDEVRLPGDRIAIRQQTTEPTAAAATRPIPPATRNETWTQAGGDAGNGGGHLEGPSSPTLAWSASAGEPVVERVRTSRPVIAGGRVFVRDGEAQALAFDAASGRELWRADLGVEDQDDDAGFGGGVAIADGRLFVTTGFGEVLALDPASGEILWRTFAGAPFRAPPATRDGVVVAVSRALEAIGLSAETGEILWRSESAMQRSGNLAGAAPAMASGVTAAPFGSGELQLLRTSRGLRLWGVTLTSPGTAQGLAVFTDITSDPVIAPGPILVAGNAGGALAAFDGRSGRRLWTRDFGSFSPVWAAGDTIFVATTQPALLRLDLRSGETLWRTPLAAWEDPEDREGPIDYGGPVLAGGRLLVTSSDGRLLSFDPQTGAELASLGMPAGSRTGPAVANGVIYVLTDEGDLLAWR